MNVYRRSLVLEAAARLTMAVVLVRCVPFRTVARRLGLARAESPLVLSDTTERIVREITGAIRIVVERAPFEYSCLAQAFAAKAMLRRRGIASTLYLGVYPGSRAVLRAHAWLRCGATVVTGGEGKEHCVAVATFAEPSATPTPDRA